MKPPFVAGVDFAGVVVGVERVERQEDETVDGSRVVPEKMWK
jgi:NADPH:quinone reductase-like Zn-dependent oxidoreductase